MFRCPKLPSCATVVRLPAMLPCGLLVMIFVGPSTPLLDSWFCGFLIQFPTNWNSSLDVGTQV